MISEAKIKFNDKKGKINVVFVFHVLVLSLRVLSFSLFFVSFPGHPFSPAQTSLSHLQVNSLVSRFKQLFRGRFYSYFLEFLEHLGINGDDNLSKVSDENCDNIIIIMTIVVAVKLRDFHVSSFNLIKASSYLSRKGLSPPFLP